MRGATNTSAAIVCRSTYFNPRAPCGARHDKLKEIMEALKYFNPRAPCGARRDGLLRALHGQLISIHAPHAGRDVWLISSSLISTFNFNPRAPCGARQQKYTKLLYTLLRQKAILRQFHAKHCLSKRFAACRSAKTSLFAVRTAAEISASFCFAL